MICKKFTKAYNEKLHQEISIYDSHQISIVCCGFKGGEYSIEILSKYLGHGRSCVTIDDVDFG